MRDALKHAKLQQCSHCKEPGATIVCAGLCTSRLHRHCLDTSGCDYDQGAPYPSSSYTSSSSVGSIIRDFVCCIV